MNKIEKMMNQIRFEFSSFFLAFSFYIHRQEFFSVLFDFRFGSPSPRKRMTRKYDRRIIKSHVFSISVSASDEEDGSDGKYISHNSTKDMKQLKKPLSRLFKIIIFKEREVRKCFRKMGLIPKSKKSSQKASVAAMNRLNDFYLSFNETKKEEKT